MLDYYEKVLCNASDVGYTESGGNEIVIQHSDNLLTRYAHLDEINVKEDQFVKDGEKIGTMGNTGTVYSTNGGDGSHMHFEVIENGQRVDPNKYLNLNRAKYQAGDYGSTYGSSSAYGSNTSTYGSTGTSTYGGSGGGSGWYWHDIEGGTILYDEEGNRLYYTPDPSRKDPYAGDPYEVSSTYEGTSSGGVEKKLPDDPDLSDYDHKFEPLIFTTSLRDYIGDRVSDFIIDKLLGPVSKLAAAFGNNKISSGSTIAVNSRLIANNDNNTITGHYSITCTKVTANDAFDGLYTSTITESGTEVYSFVGYNDYGQLLFKHNNMNFTYSEIYAKFNPENFQR